MTSTPMTVRERSAGPKSAVQPARKLTPFGDGGAVRASSSVSIRISSSSTYTSWISA
jgi:hypothetical protein